MMVAGLSCKNATWLIRIQITCLGIISEHTKYIESSKVESGYFYFMQLNLVHVATIPIVKWK